MGIIKRNDKSYFYPIYLYRAFARRQQMLRSEEESLGLQSKGACFISPHPNSFYPLSASSFSMGQLSGGSHDDDDGVEYQIYSRQNDEVFLIVSYISITLLLLW